MIEIWKYIEGYDELYQISSLGRVCSKIKILKNQIDKYGYVYTTLSKEGESKKHKIHRLVARHFLENPGNLPCVNHKNEVKTDNTINNLEWVTVAENNRLSKGVKVMLYYNNKLNCFDSAHQASIELGITMENVYTASKKTTYLLGVLEYLLSNGATLPKCSLSEDSDKGISLKRGKYIVRVTHGGVRAYVGEFDTIEMARAAKQIYIDKHCPVTNLPSYHPDLDSLHTLISKTILK